MGNENFLLGGNFVVGEFRPITQDKKEGGGAWLGRQYIEQLGPDFKQLVVR